MNDKRTPAPEFQVGREVMSLWVPQAIHAAAELGIADALAVRALSASELAARLKTHADATGRLLGALAVLGFVKAGSTAKTFELTPLGACLRSDAPNSRRAWARLMGGPAVWQAWGKLADCVRTGAPALRAGNEVFDEMLAEPEAAAVFHRAMLDGTSGQAAGIVASVDFSHVESVVDVGGGAGALLTAALEAHPRTQGNVYDLEHARVSAEAWFEQRKLHGRASFVPGDFFTAPPPRADLLLLKSVVHDFDDERSLVILRHCREALGETGRLVVVEPPAPEPNQAIEGPFAWIVAFSDLNMLVNTGGRERTRAEYVALLETAGLRVSGVKPTSGGFYSCFDCVPVG
jgi:SAM-dependent methyltransferase